MTRETFLEYWVGDKDKFWFVHESMKASKSEPIAIEELKAMYAKHMLGARRGAPYEKAKARYYLQRMEDFYTRSITHWCSIFSMNLRIEKHQINI
jgi:hypothetical protein